MPHLTPAFAASAGPAAGVTAGVTLTWTTSNNDTDSRTIYLRGVQR